MPLLNYTTTVTVQRSIGQVHALLVDAGARQVTTEYDELRRAQGVAFTIATMYGPRTFVLPVAASRVEQVLRRERVPARYATPGTR